MLSIVRSGGRLTMSSLSFLSSIQQACALSDDRRAGSSWRVEERDNPDEPWIVARPLDSVLPAQGWKLHVSATLSSALDVLTQALPVLVAARVPFKVAKTLETLASLNYGVAGSSQIGKFITVYPRDDEQAVDLAVRLDQATAGLTGPAVPSDRPLHPGSRVFVPLRWVHPGDRSASVRGICPGHSNVRRRSRA